MANEATVSCTLKITVGQLNYQANPAQFSANVTTNPNGGPTPGVVAIALSPGTNISLAGLTNQGGLCRVQNLDPTNYVTLGKWDGTTFHPYQELLPGESFPLRLSRSILSGSEFLRGQANTAPVKVLVEAFDQ